MAPWRTHTFDVEVQDVLEIGREAGEQRVVAPVVGEMRNGDRPHWR